MQVAVVEVFTEHHQQILNLVLAEQAVVETAAILVLVFLELQAQAVEVVVDIGLLRQALLVAVLVALAS